MHEYGTSDNKQTISKALFTTADVVKVLTPAQVSNVELSLLSKEAQAHARKLQSHGHLINFQDRLHLPSSLHLEVVRYLLLTGSYQAMEDLPNSLPAILTLAVQRMDPTILARTQSTSRSTGKRLELVYTTELYRYVVYLSYGWDVSCGLLIAQMNCIQYHF